MQKEILKAGKNFLACWLRVIRCGLRTQQLSLSLYLAKTLNIMENHQLLIRLDAGAAWENLALEACFRGIVTHGMEGFDYQRARQELEIPEDYDVMAMIAIGKRGQKKISLLRLGIGNLQVIESR